MKMTHELDTVTQMLAYLQMYSIEEEYQKNINILYDYISDLVKMTTEAQESAKKATDLVLAMTSNRAERRRVKKTIKNKSFPDFSIPIDEEENTNDATNADDATE